MNESDLIEYILTVQDISELEHIVYLIECEISRREMMEEEDEI